MRKNIVLVVITILLVGFMSGCKEQEEVLTDAAKFKEEYESLNGTTSSSGKEIRTVTIAEDNPMVYKSASEIVEMIDNDETFVVYFGFASCPWCRSVIEALIEVADELNIDTIYYVDVLDIRDTYAIDEDGDASLSKEGTDGYYDLLDRLDSVLSDYTLSSDDDTVSVGEKRIYAPNIVTVVEGKAISLVEGISDLQTDAYMELTEGMLSETKEIFTSALSVLSDNAVCESDKC